VHRLLAKVAERGLQLVLHRQPRALALPTFLSLAQVAQAQRHPHAVQAFSWLNQRWALS